MASHAIQLIGAGVYVNVAATGDSVLPSSINLVRIVCVLLWRLRCIVSDRPRLALTFAVWGPKYWGPKYRRRGLLDRRRRIWAC